VAFSWTRWDGLASFVERAVKRGERGARALFGIEAVVVQGTRGHRVWLRGREGVAGNTGEGQGRLLLSSTVQYCCLLLRRRLGVRSNARKNFKVEFLDDFS